MGNSVNNQDECPKNESEFISREAFYAFENVQEKTDRIAQDVPTVKAKDPAKINSEAREITKGYNNLPAFFNGIFHFQQAMDMEH
jgi:hypothetical protein